MTENKKIEELTKKLEEFGKLKELVRRDFKKYCCEYSDMECVNCESHNDCTKSLNDIIKEMDKKALPWKITLTSLIEENK